VALSFRCGCKPLQFLAGKALAAKSPIARVVFKNIHASPLASRAGNEGFSVPDRVYTTIFHESEAFIGKAFKGAAVL
jgi:hypothetical protein